MTTDNDAYAPRTDPRGRFNRKCENPNCPNGYAFRTNNPRARYCCAACRKMARNKRNYARHREERLAKTPSPGPTGGKERYGEYR